MRDLVRIKGGLEDFFVVAEVDIAALRDFLSYKEPPLGESAHFKPTPEWFAIDPRREQVPGIERKCCTFCRVLLSCQTWLTKTNSEILIPEYRNVIWFE